jgi:uncharacterized protein YjiS (DUF1127 family)
MTQAILTAHSYSTRAIESIIEAFRTFKQHRSERKVIKATERKLGKLSDYDLADIGLTRGDSWRVNSGITKVEEDEASYYFSGSSGSRYRCGKRSYMLRMNTANIWERLQTLHGGKVEMMPEDTDWMTLDWIIS